MYESPSFGETWLNLSFERYRHAAKFILAIGFRQHMFTHLRTRGVNSAFGFNIFLSSLTGGSMPVVKTIRIFAIASHRISWAKWRPGQIRRPNPNASIGYGISSLREPLALRNRSGLNESGSGNMVSSCNMALNDDGSDKPVLYSTRDTKSCL